jgi:hypothetical protein
MGYAPEEAIPCKTPAGTKLMAAPVRAVSPAKSAAAPYGAPSGHRPPKNRSRRFCPCRDRGNVRPLLRAKQDSNSIACRERSLPSAPLALPDHDRHPQNVRAVNPDAAHECDRPGFSQGAQPSQRASESPAAMRTFIDEPPGLRPGDAAAPSRLPLELTPTAVVIHAHPICRRLNPGCQLTPLTLVRIRCSKIAARQSNH